ncbi:MAG: TIR domain-containing protein [Pseudomonadota bacterium]
MMRLAEWDLSEGDDAHRIELYWGDLSDLPDQHAVDVLVVSAFRNDYIPTPGSLIGALQRNGISVYNLSFAKSYDLRDEFSCWLSQPVGVRAFKRILCIESGWRGAPPEVADDLFRALAPTSLTNIPTQSVAMPLIGAGDQGYDDAQMLEAIVMAAVGWFRRGISIEVLKIVAYDSESAKKAKSRFLKLKGAGIPDAREQNEWDVFLSYSSSDSTAADRIQTELVRQSSEIRVFRDRQSLQKGASWLMQVAYALDSCHTVLALYTPEYWSSMVCKDELSAAYVRQTRANRQVLFPVFYRHTDIPSFFQALHYVDCREADHRKLSAACKTICDDVMG